MLGPLKIKDVSVKDSGKYTCLLEVRLQNIIEYNVTDYTVIHSKYNVKYLQFLVGRNYEFCSTPPYPRDKIPGHRTLPRYSRFT